MKTVLKKINLFVTNIIYNFFFLFKVRENLILFESEGDLCDNSFALYDYMVKQGIVEHYNIVWLVSDIKSFKDSKKVKFVPKRSIVPNLRRMLYLSTARYYIYDHNNVMMDHKRRKGQQIINLWHGSPFKGGGSTEDNSEWMDLVLTSGKLFVSKTAEFVGCKETQVADIGYPRNDYLFHSDDECQKSFYHSFHLDNYDSTFLWMPTFRKSVNASLSESYFDSQTGLPLIDTSEQLHLLNEFLIKINSFCIVKIHHLQEELPVFQSQYSNILIVNDSMLKTHQIQLYQVIALSDALITDYSSVSVDYLLLDRPMIFILDDYEEYKQSRGFLFDDPREYFPGYHIYQISDFYRALEDIHNNIDKYKDSRKKLNPIMNTYMDNDTCKRVLNRLNIG